LAAPLPDATAHALANGGGTVSIASATTCGWLAAAPLTSCTDACASAGLECDEADTAVHNKDVATEEAFNSVLTNLNMDTCSPGWANTAFGSNKNVPNFAVSPLILPKTGKNAVWCAISSGTRDAFDCDAVTYLPKNGHGDPRRLCYCSGPCAPPPSPLPAPPSPSPSPAPPAKACLLGYQGEWSNVVAYYGGTKSRRGDDYLAASKYCSTGDETICDTVTDVQPYAFKMCRKITSVTIPSSVTSIGKYAFHVTEGLTAVTIPSSVTSIGDYAFASSGLTAVTIPSSVTSISRLAFAHTYALTAVTIPSGVKSIGYCAFIYTGLTAVTIPSSVTSIGEYAFQIMGVNLWGDSQPDVISTICIQGNPTIGRKAFPPSAVFKCD
jgi:hypothetical protein